MKGFFAIIMFVFKVIFAVLDFCIKTAFGLFWFLLIMFGILTKPPRGSYKGRFYGEDKYY